MELLEHVLAVRVRRGVVGRYRLLRHSTEEKAVTREDWIELAMFAVSGCIIAILFFWL